MQTIKARITVTRTTRESRELPLVDPELLNDPDTAYEVMAALFEAGIDTHDEVAIQARALPLGCPARKPTGETYYSRVRSEAWLYKTLGVSGETRVLVTSGDGGVGLWEPEQIIVVKLAAVADSWVLTDLGEMHCPK